MEVQFDINVFFSKMLAMFPAWRQAIPNPAFMQATIEAWGDVFDEEGVPNQEFLNNGLKRMAKASQSPFMPTPYQFLEHCYPTRTELGYPDADKALSLAFAHSSQKDWHKALPGIWLAWRRVEDKFGLKNDPTAAKKWRPIYDQAVNDVIRGHATAEEIALPQPPDQVAQVEFTPEQIKENKAKASMTIQDLLESLR